jgi:hypothetical protein
MIVPQFQGILLLAVLPWSHSVVRDAATLAGYIPVFRVGEALKVPVVAASGAPAHSKPPGSPQQLVSLETTLPSNLEFYMVKPQAQGSQKPSQVRAGGTLDDVKIQLMPSKAL